MKTQDIYKIAQIPRCRECEAFHQRVARAGVPSLFHAFQEGNDAQYSRPMHVTWWYGVNIFFASGALIEIFRPSNSTTLLGFLIGFLVLSTLACASYVKKVDSKDALRSRLASGLLNTTYFSIYLFASIGSRLLLGLIFIYLIKEIFRGIQINRVRVQELKNRGVVPRPFYFYEKHPSYMAIKDTQVTTERK